MKTSISEKIRRFAQMVMALGEDPMDLYKQIRPLLSKLQLSAAIQNDKIKLIPGEARKDDSLYCVTVRRKFMLTPDHIERLKRNIAFLNYIAWNQNGVELYLWYPYVAPEQATPNPKPLAPGTPVAPPGAPIAPI